MGAHTFDRRSRLQRLLGRINRQLAGFFRSRLHSAASLALPMAVAVGNDRRGDGDGIEQVLGRIFDFVPDIVSVRRLKDGYFRYVNEEFTRILGWTREEALSRSIDELGLWYEPGQKEEFFRRFEAEGFVRNFETKARLRGNTGVKTLLVSAVRIDLDGEPHLVAVLRDVSSMRQMEQRLRESEVRLRTIFDASPDVIAVMRMPDERYVYVNPGFSRATGYSESEAVGRTAVDLGIFPDRQTYEACRAQLGHAGVIRSFEHNIRTKDGNIVPHLSSQVIVELDGEPHLVVIAREISAIKRAETELIAARERLSQQVEELRRGQWALRAEMVDRLQTEARLRRSESKLRKVFEASLDGVAIRSLRDNRVLDVNPELLRLLNRTREEMIGVDVRELHIWHDPAAEHRFFTELAMAGEVRNFEADLRRKDGTAVPSVVSGARIDLDGEPCLIIVCRDNAKFKEYERQLIAARELLAAQVDALHASQRELQAQIIERELAEQRALRGERNLRQVFDTSLVMFSVNRLSDFVFLEANQEFFDRSGFRPEEVIGRSPMEIGLWPLESDYRHFHERLLTDGRVRDYTGDFREKSGRLMSMLLSAVTIERDGETCFVVIGRDITELKAKERQLLAARGDLSRQVEALNESHRLLYREIAERRQTERSLLESETKLRQVFETSLDAISIRSLGEHRYIDVNPAFLNLTGYSRDEVIGHTLDELRLRADNLGDKFIAAIRTQGFVHNMEGSLRRKDGRLVPILTSAVATEIGGELAIIAVTRDITMTKLTEARLRENERRFREIFDANLDAISLRRMHDNVYREVNSEFLRLTGYSREEVIGRSCEELGLLNPQDLLLHDRTIETEGKLQNAEVEIRRKDGSLVPVMLSAVKIELGGELYVLAIMRDITERKRIDREMIAARDAALAASRAKSEFLSNMSHEIRTPLNAILGMAEVLAETRLDTEQRRYVETMQTNGNALLHLIDDILDLAKVESGALTLVPTLFDLTDLIERMVDTFAFRARDKRLDLTHRIEPGVPRFCIGDSLRLRQILINLLANAVKFTERGSIVLTVANATVGPSNDADSKRTWLKFSVADTGIGIAPAHLQSIFASFTQADPSISRKYGGTGLGLAIVQRLVNLFDGTVAVDSTPGRGSTFSFTVPLEIADDAAVRRASALGAIGSEAEGSESQFGARPEETAARILLAEDSADNRFLIRTYLRNTGYCLDEAADGRAAIEMFQAGGYDVVLMDLQMPALDGLSATRAIRELEAREGRRRTTIIALTASALDEAVRQSIEAGCDSHLSKPVRKETLLKALADAAGQRESEDGAAADGSGNGDGGPGQSFRVTVSEQLRPLVGGFLDRKRADVQRLKKAIDESDFELIAAAGHQLTGEGGSYELDRISEIGRQLERAALARDRMAVTAWYRALRRYLDGIEVVYI
jgi:PAS domain S-box-containing protein